MSYSDFIYFFLSDLDKGTTMATKYWYRCYDLDNAGCSDGGNNSMKGKDETNCLSLIVLRQMYTQQYARFQSVFPSSSSSTTTTSSVSSSLRRTNSPDHKSRKSTSTTSSSSTDKYSFDAICKLTMDGLSSSLHSNSHSHHGDSASASSSSLLSLSTLLHIVSPSPYLSLSSSSSTEVCSSSSLAVRKEAMTNFWNAMFNLRQYTTWDTRCYSSGCQPLVRSTTTGTDGSASSVATTTSSSSLVDGRCWQRFTRLLFPHSPSHHGHGSSSHVNRLKTSASSSEFYLHEEPNGEVDEEEEREEEEDNECGFQMDEELEIQAEESGVFF